MNEWYGTLGLEKPQLWSWNMYQKHWLSGWYIKFSLCLCWKLFFFWYRVGQIQITESTFCNSSSINCCKPSEIQNAFFSWLVEKVAVYKRKRASRFILFITKGNHNAHLQAKRKRSYLRKRTERKYAKVEIFFGGNMPNFYFISISWIYITLQLEKNK